MNHHIPTSAAADGHNQNPAAEESYQTHHLPSINATILLRQIPSQGIPFQTWPAAVTLLILLDAHRRCPNPLLPIPPQPRILELGSGTGLVGIAAAALFSARVTVTDLPAGLPNLQFNVATNAATLAAHSGTVEAAALPWGDRQKMEAIGKDYNVVLGSDLVYHEELYLPLIETLRFLLVGEKGAFLMAHSKRWKKESGFFRKAKKYFNVEAVERSVAKDGDRVGIVVYKFVGK